MLTRRGGPTTNRGTSQATARNVCGVSAFALLRSSRRTPSDPGAPDQALGGSAIGVASVRGRLRFRTYRTGAAALTRRAVALAARVSDARIMSYIWETMNIWR